MPETLTPDICVIGGGSGGLSVAAAAAAFGVDVVLVEKGEMGGDCLNTGCVPSKALLAAANAAETARSADRFGIDVPEPTADYSGVNDYVRSVIDAIAPHDSVERFEGLGVTVLKEHARFTGPGTVEAGGHVIKARRFVIATGSRPAIPPIPGLETVPFLTNESLFDLRELPDHLLVVGGGPIGLEMAQAHRRLGARVTVLEARRALGRDDPNCASIVLKVLRAQGIDLREYTKVEKVAAVGKMIAVETVAADGSASQVTGSHLLVASGRSPSVDGLGLDAAGIDYDRRGIKVSAGMRTSNRRVYAIGDVAGGLQFTHVAGHQAGLVIKSILFRLPARMRPELVPWVTFTSPEIGHVGLSEEAARAVHGDRVKVLFAGHVDNDRARTEGRTEGCLKLIAGPGGRLLGADIVGAGAGEILNLLSLALSRKLTMKDLAGFISPYPTLGELVRRAAISYYADAPGNVWVRRILKLLRRFG